MAHVETVLVEESDDRLASVELAKRTGNAFESVGTRGAQVVPLDIAVSIAEEKANQDTTVYRGRSIAAHREDYIDQVRNDPTFVPRTNEEKAAAHAEYSAELVRQQIAQEKKNRELKEEENFDFAAARQEENRRLAEAYEEAIAPWQRERIQRAKGATDVVSLVQEIVTHVDVNDIASRPLGERVAAFSDFVEVPNALEVAAQEALTIKDAIISTEEDYRAHAAGGVVTDTDQREAQVEEVESEDVVAPDAVAVAPEGRKPARRNARREEQGADEVSASEEASDNE